MKLIKLGFFKTLEFEDSDTNYECMKKLMEYRDENTIDKTDFNIICSMFELHQDLPPVAKVLYDNGFTLPENEVIPSCSQNAA